jgi:tyrosyl-tRNA synthetase
VAASAILFGKSTAEDLKQLPEKVFLEVFDGVPSAEVSKARFDEGLDMIAALAAETGFFASNGEARRELKQQSISVNKSKVGEDYRLSSEDLIASKYVLLQKGKKNYYLLKVV